MVKLASIVWLNKLYNPAELAQLFFFFCLNSYSSSCGQYAQISWNGSTGFNDQIRENVQSAQTAQFTWIGLTVWNGSTNQNC